MRPEMSHSTSYSDSNSEEFKCSICGKTFAGRSYLRNHELLHREDRPFPCHLCDSAFVLKSRLQNHMLVLHNVMPYRCGKCNVEFAKKRDMVAHECVTVERAEMEKNAEENIIENAEDDSEMDKGYDQTTREKLGNASFEPCVDGQAGKISDDRGAGMIPMRPMTMSIFNHRL